MSITISAFDFDICLSTELTIFVMLYVLLGRNKNQNILNAYGAYSKRWQLSINTSKRKIVIFGVIKKDHKKIYG